jgi:hypothetical protein
MTRIVVSGVKQELRPHSSQWELSSTNAMDPGNRSRVEERTREKTAVPHR